MKRLLIVLVDVLTTCSSMYVSTEETATPVNQEHAPFEKKRPI